MFRGWWKLAIAIVLVVIGVCFGYDKSRVDAWIIFCISAVGFALLIYGAAWFRQSKVIGDWIQQQGDVPILYLLSEEMVDTSSMMGSTKLKWDAFSKLAITDFDTLLIFPREGALTFPPSRCLWRQWTT